ncbi:protein SCO1/2 [Paenibacillus catalpae]|uniref:Protein SCO1/2 n=1 Tax=Paenibacillus catalpae TaxID=1045775 RepID=A0A1I1Y723_9BACL|nr:SCO family protein [Paenibacillus catalpae]SFE14798.1 protein SCO1/2 [Paenibacillus catalpae]
MAFLKKHSFKFAVLALCLAMGIYLFITNYSQSSGGSKMPVQMAAPSFAMNDIDGNEVSLESTNGKARLVYFYFASCPDVCPPTTFMISEVEDQLREAGILGTKAELISITFDPTHDTPDVIRDFATRNFAQLEDGGWEFLRGNDEEATLKLARDFGVSVKRENDTFIHMNVITLVDKKGQIRKWINGSDESLTPESMVADLKQLAKE